MENKLESHLRSIITNAIIEANNGYNFNKILIEYDMPLDGNEFNNIDFMIDEALDWFSFHYNKLIKMMDIIWQFDDYTEEELQGNEREVYNNADISHHTFLCLLGYVLPFVGKMDYMHQALFMDNIIELMQC
jgi:hypothetical protein